MCFLSAFVDPPQDLPRFARIRDAADALDVTPQTLRTWIRDGRLPSFRIAQTIRIPRTALECIAEHAAATIDNDHPTPEDLEQ